MRARAATVGDLEDVFRGLSSRMSDEYVAAGKDSKSDYDNLMMNLKEGRAHALVQDDRTVAIIARHENADAFLQPGHVPLLQAPYPPCPGPCRQPPHTFAQLAGQARRREMVPRDRLC